MNLPTARNTTYSPSTPIQSADINALQDCVIGNKHPVREIVIPAEAFVVLAGTATLGDGRWTFGAVSDLVAAPLPFYVGERITQITWAYDRGGAGNVTVILRGRQLIPSVGAQPAHVDHDTYTDSTTAAGWHNEVRAGINYTVVAGEGLSLFVQCDNAAHVFGGARVFYDCL